MPAAFPLSPVAPVASAVVVAVAAQWLVDVGSRRIGLVLHLAAAALAFIGAAAARGLWEARVASPVREVGAGWAASLGAVTVVAVINALRVDIAAPSDTFWIVHLATIAAALAIAVAADRARRPAAGANASTNREELLTRRAHVVLLALVAVIAVGLRLVDLASLPEGVWFDEATHGNDARRMLDDPDYRPLWIAETYLAPAHHSYLIAAAVWLGFGTVTAIRIVSVAFGLLAVAGAHVVGRELWGRVGALGAVILIGLGRWPVTVSRIGMFNVVTPAALLLGVGLVLVGMRRDSATTKLAGGGVLGLGLAFHSSMVLGLGGVVVVLSVLSGSLRHALRVLWIPAVGLVLVAAPIAAVAIREPDLYTARQDQVSLFNEGHDDTLEAALRNARKVAGVFHVEGDRNGRHNIPGEPLLDPVAGGLVVVGGALALRHLRRPLAAAVLVWGLITLVPGVITLSSEAPNALRIIGAMPVVFLVGTTGIVAVAAAVPRRAVPAVLGVLVVASAGWTIKDYFGDFRDDPRVWAAHSIGETIAARQAAAATADAEVVSVEQFVFSGVMGLLAPGTVDHTVAHDEVYPLRIAGEEDTVIIAGPESRALVAEHRRVFPESEVTEHRRGDVLGATVIEVPAHAVQAQQGLVATYERDDGGEPLVRTERLPGGDPTELAVDLPVAARWDGLLVVERTGLHGFTMAGTSDLTITIDGEPVSAEAALVHVGPHHLTMSATVTGDAPVVFQWRPPGADLFTVPPGNLWQHDGTPHGLFGSGRGGEDGAGELSRSRLDASLDFRVGQADAARPRLLRWEGLLDVPTGGLYRLGLVSLGPRRVSVDGRPVVLADGPDTGELYLTAGLHPLEVQVVDAVPATDVRLLWGPPGEAMTTIPSSVLLPPWAVVTP